MGFYGASMVVTWPMTKCKQLICIRLGKIESHKRKTLLAHERMLHCPPPPRHSSAPIVQYSFSFGSIGCQLAPKRPLCGPVTLQSLSAVVVVETGTRRRKKTERTCPLPLESLIVPSHFLAGQLVSNLCVWTGPSSEAIKRLDLACV